MYSDTTSGAQSAVCVILTNIPHVTWSQSFFLNCQYLFSCLLLSCTILDIYLQCSFFFCFFCTVLCLVIFSYFWSVHYFVLQLNIDLRNLHSLLTCIIRPCETQLYFVCPNFIILLYVDVIFVYFRRYFQLPLDFFLSFVLLPL